MDYVEAFLTEAEESEYQDEGEALAHVQVIVGAINAEITKVQPGTVSPEFLNWGNPAKRLMKWLKRLYELMKGMATKFGAFSYSVSVGFPSGVSVDIQWAGPRQ